MANYDADLLCWDLFCLMEALELIRANPYYEFSHDEYTRFVLRVSKVKEDIDDKRTT